VSADPTQQLLIWLLYITAPRGGLQINNALLGRDLANRRLSLPSTDTARVRARLGAGARAHIDARNRDADQPRRGRRRALAHEGGKHVRRGTQQDPASAHEQLSSDRCRSRRIRKPVILPAGPLLQSQPEQQRRPCRKSLPGWRRFPPVSRRSPCRLPESRGNRPSRESRTGRSRRPRCCGCSIQRCRT
jgi:hypothetical protein